jgi:flagellar biosynthesis/type III secretory pathway chaperone
MNEFKASTEQHELLTSELGCSENSVLTPPNSDSTPAIDSCEKKQRLIDEIDQLTTRRDKYLRTAEEQYAEMELLEALLEGDEELDANRLREVRSEYNTLKLPYDSNKHHAWLLDAQINRREQLLNHETLMAGYAESMANWIADELELNEKRESLSTRL